MKYESNILLTEAIQKFTHGMYISRGSNPENIKSFTIVCSLIE